MKLDDEFPEFAAQRVRKVLAGADVNEDSVLALFGAGSPFGLTRLSHVIKLVEADIRGRLVVFFGGQRENNS